MILPDAIMEAPPYRNDAHDLRAKQMAIEAMGLDPLTGMTQERWSALDTLWQHRIADKHALTSHPQLAGKEGMRVEVVDLPGDKPRRFWVGTSSGWRPCFIEIKLIHSTGGHKAAREYHAIKVIYARGTRA